MKAGLVIKTPAVIPIIVVIAKPFNKPAPAHNKGSNATTAVKYAPKMMVNALFILCFIVKNVLCLASSKIIICWSIPVPIVAKIPAMLGKSRFHSIKEAIPKIIITSEMLVINKAIEDLNFLYLKKIITETARSAANPANKIDFMNSSPRTGEIISNLTISNLYGRLPVIKIVWSLCIDSFEASYASSLVSPVSEPEIAICVVTLPLSPSPIKRLSTRLSSK